MTPASTLTLRELAQMLRAPFIGDPELVLERVSPIESAERGAVTFLANKKYIRHLEHTQASAVILGEDVTVTRDDLATIRMKDPYLGFVATLRHFHPVTRTAAAGVHASASVDPGARIGTDVTIGPHAVLFENVTVGEGSVIGAGAVLTAGVTVGRDCLIHPNVTVLAQAQIGDRVIIHAGTTIGSDGFGFAPVEERWEKIPQVGTVIIEDDVEIGANCTIDRATLGRTVICRGSKLDNLIQIAHNVRIGEDSVIAAQSGISGSTTLGRHVIIAGQVGLVGHIEIGDGVIVGAQSGVSKSLAGSGKMFRGSPARDIQDELRSEAAIRRLPDLLATVRAIENRLRAIEERLDTPMSGSQD